MTLYETRRVATLSRSNDGDTSGHRQQTAEAIQKFKEFFEANGFLEEQPIKRFKCDGSGGQVSPETFRLISSKLPPRPILLHAPPPKIRSSSPKIQDSPDQRRRRHVRAREAAIEGEQIIAQSTRETRGSPVNTFKSTSFKQPAVAVVVYNQESNDVKVKVPIVSVSSTDPKPPPKRKRRRFKAKPPRLPPAFHRPSRLMGPRATGYALGYQGSWMVEDPSKAAYERDKMKRGRMKGS